MNYVLKGSFCVLGGEQAEEARVKAHKPGRRPRERWFGPSGSGGGTKC